MQPTSVLAFRKRMKKRGYTDISIKHSKDTGNYVVTATEPLAKTRVSAEYTVFGCYHAFRF